MPLYTEMVAPAAALVGLNRSNLCRDNRSCSVPGSAATKRASGVLSEIFVHQAAESSYCIETKEYIGVIDLYGGGGWERFSMLPSDLHAPSSTSTWSRFGARLVSIFF
jgi:hypothetical protein